MPDFGLTRPHRDEAFLGVALDGDPSISLQSASGGRRPVSIRIGMDHDGGPVACPLQRLCPCHGALGGVRRP